jgi:5-dehydro-4-deoxyglucarate dehydratase
VPGYYAIGIRTYTSSIATIAPRLSMQLHERASLLDNASLSRLMRNYVLPLYGLRARRKGYEVSVMKVAMELIGKPAGPVRPPLPMPRPEEVEEIKALMEAYDPVL